MLFSSEQDILAARQKVNQTFRDDHSDCKEHFITADEERILCRKFERELLRFCNVSLPESQYY